MAIASTEPSPSNTKLIPVHIDPTTSLYLDPAPLPTSLGVSRIFVSSSYRRQGIAHHLLNQAARTFLRGCELDPEDGEIAFSQPTAMGRAVMESWGRGGIRVYEE
jgi:N-acetyltransferase